MRQKTRVVAVVAEPRHRCGARVDVYAAAKDGERLELQLRLVEEALDVERERNREPLVRVDDRIRRVRTQQTAVAWSQLDGEIVAGRVAQNEATKLRAARDWKNELVGRLQFARLLLLLLKANADDRRANKTTYRLRHFGARRRQKLEQRTRTRLNDRPLEWRARRTAFARAMQIRMQTCKRDAKRFALSSF